MATYSIIGAGSSSGNPVTVFAGCEETVNICWTGRIEVDGYCSECTYYDGQYCDSVSGVTESTTGTIPWSGGTSVHYKIIKNCVPEPVPQPCSSYTCSDFSLYTVPSYIDLVNPPTNIDIHYNYLITYKDDDGHICGREELSNVDSIDFDDFEPSGDTKYVYSFAPLSDACSATSGVATVYVLSDEDTCDSGVTVDVTTSFSPSVVPALPSSGTDVTINVMCRKVEVSKDCTKKITNTGNTLVWHVKCCTDCSENSGCCTDHTVSSAFTMEYIRDLAGVDEDAVIRYNGVKATSEIPFSIVQKGKDTEECSASTEDKVTKYCVSSCTGDVEYEDSYMSNTWSGTCVPFGGGRIKVSWDYSAFTYSCVGSDCTLISHSDSAMTWEEIIDIPACDERIFCIPESEYDPIRDKDKCACSGGCTHACPDGECSYTCPNNDGKVSGTCELYFKEQALPADCTTCEGEVPPGETEKFNVITYTFVQDCKSECTPYTNTIYGNINPETGEIEKVSAYTSDYVEDSKCYNENLEITVNGIPYTSVTEYVGSLCPERETDISTTSTTVTVKMIPNNSDSERLIYEDDMICVVQEAGPCDDDTLCGAEVTLISGLARGDYALVEFYTVEPESLQATYSIKSGETASYYSEDESVIVGLDSDPDNSNDYIYKYYGSTEEIPSRVTLGCGEGISSAISAVAESYCACKKLKAVSGRTDIPNEGGDEIIASFSADTNTCSIEDFKLAVKVVGEPNIIKLDSVGFNADGTLSATVSANTSDSDITANYVMYNTKTSEECPKGKFTIKQLGVVRSCDDVTYVDSEECITCDCNEDDFNLLVDSINVPAEGLIEEPIATVNACIGHLVFDESGDWGCDIQNGETLKITVPAFETSRSETITFTYSADCGTDIWEKTLTLNQGDGGCSCASITYEGTEEPDPEPEPAIGKLYIKLGTAPSWATSGNYDIFLVKDDFTESLVNQLKESDPTVDGTTDSEGRTYLCDYQISNNAGTCTYVEDSLASAGLWMFYNDGGTVNTTDFIEETLCWVYIREKTGQKRIERLDNRVEFKPSSVNCNDYVMMT